ncbi:MAG: CapA family protein [Spirochaetales bacterium]|nr:CapA family protein [Spirochaetales bacterium]
MKKQTMLAAGDIILGKDPEKYFAGVDTVLKKVDLSLGQLEVPYSDKAPELADLHRQLKNLTPLSGRFDVLTLAGNHIYDAKEIGVIDTIGWLEDNHISYTGAGLNLAHAKRPALVEKEGVRYGILSYNCTGPKVMSATEKKPGCAFVDIVTHYELGDVANPGGNPTKIYTFPEPVSFRGMLADIRELRGQCDVLIVYLHKGIVHKPVKLADYEQVVSYAAIDAGADVIFSSHSHILHGIEVYKEKTIYHGLNNFIAWVPSLSPNFKFKNGVRNEVFDPEQWARNRIEMFGFIPDPAYPTYPFHPESIYTILAKCLIEDGIIVQTRFIPMIVNKAGVPEVVTRKGGGEEVLEYMVKITEGAHLNALYEWDEDELIIRSR